LQTSKEQLHLANLAYHQPEEHITCKGT